jgi:hypothetical protein
MTAIPALFSPEHAELLDTDLDAVLVALTIGVSTAAGVLFGIAPALQGTGAPAALALRADAGGVSEQHGGSGILVADIRKMGTHNTPKNTVAITSLTAYTNGIDAAKSKDLILNEEILLRKETHYFFGNDYNNFVRSGKKKLLHLFPKDEVTIENYLKENKVDFDKKEDLQKLAKFLSEY